MSGVTVDLLYQRRLRVSPLVLDLMRRQNAKLNAEIAHQLRLQMNPSELRVVPVPQADGDCT